MEDLSPLVTALVGLITGGALLQLSKTVHDFLRRRQFLSQHGQSFINKQYEEMVERLQSQVTMLRERTVQIDRSYQEEIKCLLRQTADLRVENATIKAELAHQRGTAPPAEGKEKTT